MTTTLYNYTPHSITLNSGEKYDSVGVARVRLALPDYEHLKKKHGNDTKL